MHCFKRLGERAMARTFERQVVELHIRVAPETGGVQQSRRKPLKGYSYPWPAAYLLAASPLSKLDWHSLSRFKRRQRA